MITIFISLVIILIVLFAFIFIGVSAFAIPGTFGAIVNSIFPIAGGVGVSSTDSTKDKKYDVDKLK